MHVLPLVVGAILAAGSLAAQDAGPADTPSSPVTVLVHYRAQPGQAEVARRELESLIATVVVREPDCRGIRLLQDPKEPERILLVEEWTSEAVFFGPHSETPYLREFIERSRDFLAGPPEIRVWRELTAIRRGARGD